MSRARTGAVAEVGIHPLAVERFRELLAENEYERFLQRREEIRRVMDGRVLWNVNSTAKGGGVAEMLASLLAYAAGSGVDARWLVIRGDPDFFRVTKRIHNRLHDDEGDGGPLGDEE